DKPTAVETMNATLTTDPDLQDVAPRLPPGLELLVRHCLEKDADDRFQSARDLAFQLSTLASGGLSQSREAIAGPRQAPQRVVTPKRIAAAALGLAALVATFLAGSRSGSAPPPPYRQLTFRRGAVMTARFSPDGATIVYGAEWEG